MQKRWRHRLENMMQYVIKKSEGMGGHSFSISGENVQSRPFLFFYCCGWHIYGTAV